MSGMAINAARRGFGVVLALSVAFLPTLMQPAVAAASTTGSLFALGPSIVAKADPTTGVLTTFANLPLPPRTGPAPTFNGLASDPVGHRLFVARTAYCDPTLTCVTHQLITIDSRTAAISISPDMGQAIGDLVFDTSSGILYGHNQVCCPFTVLRIDPATGTLTHVADLPGVQQSLMAVAPSKHAIYMQTESFVLGQVQPVFTMLTLDTSTGAISQSPPLSTGLFALAYDTSSGTLFAKTFCCPAQLLSVDPNTGAETLAASLQLGLGSAFTIDSSSHTIFVTEDNQGAFSFTQDIRSINDQTGASSVSGTLPTNTYVGTLAFEPAALVTPESIEVDLWSAFKSGAITNADVATTLLFKLDVAEAARSKGNCSAAAKAYGWFTFELNAQSGKTVAPATATQLISEAKFLIANCP
jgi:hypothetical protein